MKSANFFILKSHVKNLAKYYAAQRWKQKVCFTFKDGQLQSITLQLYSMIIPLFLMFIL